MDTPNSVKLMRVRRMCDMAIRYNTKLDPRAVLDAANGRKA